MNYYYTLMLGNSFSAQWELIKLDAAVADTKGHSVKESTKKNLLCHLSAYEKFCNRYLLDYFPCNNKQLCRFGQHLSTTFESPDSVSNYISGLRTCMALLGLEVQDAADRQMTMFTTGLKKGNVTCSEASRTSHARTAHQTQQSSQR